eukprot:scaffold8293_cov123-Isochrysis_galbana.AAC.1
MHGLDHLDPPLGVPQLSHHRRVGRPAETVCDRGGGSVRMEDDRDHLVVAQVVDGPRAVAKGELSVLEDGEVGAPGEEGRCVVIRRRQLVRLHGPLEPAREFALTKDVGVAAGLGALGDGRVHRPVLPLDELGHSRGRSPLCTGRVDVGDPVLGSVDGTAARARMRPDRLPPRVDSARGQRGHVGRPSRRVVREAEDVEPNEYVAVARKGVVALEHGEEGGEEDPLEVPVLRGGRVAGHDRRVGGEVKLREGRLEPGVGDHPLEGHL